MSLLLGSFETPRISELESTLDQSINAQSQINENILQSLDGYQTQINDLVSGAGGVTFTQFNNAQDAQQETNQDILKSLDGYISYMGATGDINLGSNSLSVGDIYLNSNVLLHANTLNSLQIKKIDNSDLANLSVKGINTNSIIAEIRNITFSDSPYSLFDEDYTILANSVGGNIIINLSSAGSNNRGRIINIKKIDTSGFIITIIPFGLETIDNQISQQIGSPYNNIQIQSDGNSWFII